MAIKTQPAPKIRFAPGGRCRICSHPQHAQINQDLLSGMTQTDVAYKYGLTINMVFKHCKNHLADMIAKAEAERLKAEEAANLKKNNEIGRKARLAIRKEEAVNTVSALEDQRLIFGRKASRELRQLKDAVGGIFASSYKDYMDKKSKDDGVLSLNAAKDWAFLTGIQAKVVERLHEISVEEAKAEFDIFSSPELQQFLALLYKVLSPFPEAREEVAKAILTFIENDCVFGLENDEVIDV